MEFYFVFITVAVLLISLGIFVFLAWYFSHKAKHRERLKLIEKGINPESDENGNNRRLWRKTGIILSGLGGGLLIISILVLTYPKIINTGSMPLAILALCGGIALVISNKDKRS